MNAVLDMPETTRPVRPAPTGEAPPPEACWRCHGTKVEPGTVPAVCTRCYGSGIEAARFDLMRGRSYELRRVAYRPSCSRSGMLTLGCAVTKDREIQWATYEVIETANDFSGRSFALRKQGETDEAEEVRYVLIRETEMRCDCRGKTYLSAEKANQRAWENGQEVFFSAGCKHLDSLRALVKAGYFPDPVE